MGVGVDDMTDIAGAAANGINSLWHIAPIVTILVLVIIVLLYFIRLLLQDAREERKVVRDTLAGNTAVMSRLEELIRTTVHR